MKNTASAEIKTKKQKTIVYGVHCISAPLRASP